MLSSSTVAPKWRGYLPLDGTVNPNEHHPTTPRRRRAQPRADPRRRRRGLRRARPGRLARRHRRPRGRRGGHGLPALPGQGRADRRAVRGEDRPRRRARRRGARDRGPLGGVHHLHARHVPHAGGGPRLQGRAAGARPRPRAGGRRARADRAAGDEAAGARAGGRRRARGPRPVRRADAEPLRRPDRRPHARRRPGLLGARPDDPHRRHLREGPHHADAGRAARPRNVHRGDGQRPPPALLRRRARPAGRRLRPIRRGTPGRRGTPRRAV